MIERGTNPIDYNPILPMLLNFGASRRRLGYFCRFYAASAVFGHCKKLRKDRSNRTKYTLAKFSSLRKVRKIIIVPFTFPLSLVLLLKFQKYALLLKNGMYSIVGIEF